MRPSFRGPLKPPALSLLDALATREERQARRRSLHPPPFHRVLVGYDGSPAAEWAVAWAAEMGRSARVTLMQVGDTVEEHGGPIEHAAAALRANQVDVHTRTERGDPTRVLLDASEELDADLVIVGHSGKGPLARAVLGSVGDALLRRSGRSLLLARGPAAIEHVLVGVDGSSNSDEALRTAVLIAVAVDARATILTVAKGGRSTPGAPRPSPMPAEVFDLHPDERARLELVVEHGQPSAVILEWVHSRGPDLVVLGRTGGSQRRLLGSVARTVATQASSSVLLVR